MYIMRPYKGHGEGELLMTELLKNGIQDMPLQRCEKGEDIRVLADYELVAIIIGTGSRGRNVLEVSMDVMKQFVCVDDMYQAGIREMSSISGLGIRKAIRLQASIELGRRLMLPREVAPPVDCPQKVWRLLHGEMAFSRKEEFWVLVLNNKNHVLRKTRVSVGTVSETIVHPREIFREAIRESGSSVIVAHNHPSGILTPSPHDLHTTRRLHEAGKLVGIPLVDHLIVSNTSYLSLKEEGYIPE